MHAYIVRTAWRRLDRASARIFAFYPEMTSFSFSCKFFGVNWIPTSFSLVSMAVRAERMALYIGHFYLNHMHVPYNKEANHTYLQAS